MQRGHSIVICFINIRSCCNKDFYDFRITKESSHMQRSLAIVVCFINIRSCRNKYAHDF